MAPATRRRPHKSPKKTRPTTNHKVPAHAKQSKCPLDGAAVVKPAKSSTPSTVPEREPLKVAAGWCEALVVWTALLALVFFIVFGADDTELINIFSKTPIPPTAHAVPFSVTGLLRKAFSLPSRD